ncbi:MULTISPECIES: hypothetical protein [unclassified Coleofasciculus]|nr:MULTISPECIES: hypothetical protein [unclassified Coleofasciculus]MBE9126635.1 hypothetical protein [Coleofasciculus sp. LEGE 07081]MBE9148887.1 hypothetical protein [Coleofasciculus sp. LEGE 07092]
MPDCKTIAIATFQSPILQPQSLGKRTYLAALVKIEIGTIPNSGRVR